MAEQTIDIKGRLAVGRRLAIQVNPQKHITHKLRVVKKLKLADEARPEEIPLGDWVKILDHWDTDKSTGLERGVFYIPGDIAEVDRFEAADLLTVLPTYFEPADELTAALLASIQSGGQ